MTSTKALAHFRNVCKTRIVADAGPEGIGAVLLQLQGEEWRAVSYASRNPQSFQFFPNWMAVYAPGSWWKGVAVYPLSIEILDAFLGGRGGHLYLKPLETRRYF